MRGGQSGHDRFHDAGHADLRRHRTHAGGLRPRLAAGQGAAAAGKGQDGAQQDCHRWPVHHAQRGPREAEPADSAGLLQRRHGARRGGGRGGLQGRRPGRVERLARRCGARAPQSLCAHSGRGRRRIRRLHRRRGHRAAGHPPGRTHAGRGLRRDRRGPDRPAGRATAACPRLPRAGHRFRLGEAGSWPRSSGRKPAIRACARIRSRPGWRSAADGAWTASSSRHPPRRASR